MRLLLILVLTTILHAQVPQVRWASRIGEPAEHTTLECAASLGILIGYDPGYTYRVYVWLYGLTPATYEFCRDPALVQYAIVVLGVSRIQMPLPIPGVINSTLYTDPVILLPLVQNQDFPREWILDVPIPIVVTHRIQAAAVILDPIVYLPTRAIEVRLYQ